MPAPQYGRRAGIDGEYTAANGGLSVKRGCAMALRHLCIATALIMAAPAVESGGIAQSIVIDGFSYTPANADINYGETVSFEASGFHPLRFDDTADIACDVDCDVTFLAAGPAGFYCSNHGGPNGSGMSGTLTVAENLDVVFAGTFQHTLTL